MSSRGSSVEELAENRKNNFFQNLLNRIRGEKAEVLKEGAPNTIVTDTGRVISSDAAGNTSFFGGLFGGQSSIPFQNRRALGLADILTLDRFDFDKRGSVFGVSDATGLGGPGDDYKITSSGTYVEKNPKKDKSGTDDGGKYFEENMELLGRISKLAEEARQKDFMREGIRNIMYAPVIGAQANLRAAQGINDLTIANMGAMAAQNQVLATNPAKQKIAGKYFRL